MDEVAHAALEGAFRVFFEFEVDSALHFKVAIVINGFEEVFYFFDGAVELVLFAEVECFLAVVEHRDEVCSALLKGSFQGDEWHGCSWGFC